MGHGTRSGRFAAGDLGDKGGDASTLRYLVHEHKWNFGLWVPVRYLLAASRALSRGRCTIFGSIDVVAACVHDGAEVHSASEPPKYSQPRVVVQQNDCISKPKRVFWNVVILWHMVPETSISVWNEPGALVGMRRGRQRLVRRGCVPACER